MKAKRAVFIAAVVIMGLFVIGSATRAIASEFKTHHTIYVTIIVPGNLSMNLDEGMMRQNLLKPEAEAFTELKGEGISVDKVSRGDSTLWLFTKTE